MWRRKKKGFTKVFLVENKKDKLLKRYEY